MPAGPSVTPNGTPTDDSARIAMAMALLEEADKKAKAKAEAKAKREAERSVPGYTAPPNAPHVFLRRLVTYVTNSNLASNGDNDKFHSDIMALLPFVDTVAKGDNTTQSRDFEVIGNLIATMTPSLPVPSPTE